MSTPSNVSGYFADLTPFRAIARDANYLVIVPQGFGATGPQYSVLIGERIPGSAPVAGTATTPEKAAVPDAFIQHRAESLVLTREEWDNWDKSVDDEAYIRGIAISRFGLTLK